MHAVGIIFEDEDKNILVLKRHRRSLEGNTWGLVGGGVDAGEDAAAAAIREAVEEIGHNVSPLDLEFSKTYRWQHQARDIRFDVFKYKTLQKKIDIELNKDENTEFMWADPRTLLERDDLMVGLYPILKDEYLE